MEVLLILTPVHVELFRSKHESSALLQDTTIDFMKILFHSGGASTLEASMGLEAGSQCQAIQEQFYHEKRQVCKQKRAKTACHESALVRIVPVFAITSSRLSATQWGK